MCAEPIEIPLRRRDGSVRAVAIVDDADAALATAYRWRYANGYAITGQHRRGDLQWLHRAVCGLGRTLADDPREVDHRDGNGLNNTRANLRVVTHQQNGQNRRAQRGSSAVTSPHRGVSWNARDRCWYARVTRPSDGKRVHLGVFDNEADAARAAAAFYKANVPYAEEVSLHARD